MDRKTNQLEKLIKKAARKYKGMPIALSGGIDSGLLAALIKPKFAINVELPGGEKYNESDYARLIAQHLGITLHVVKLDDSKFKEITEKAVRIVGKPIPHFNHFPLYEMYKALWEVFRVKDLVLADGPDESMCGYTRHLLMDYFYKVVRFDAFIPYMPLITKILPAPWEIYQEVIGIKFDKYKLPAKNLIQWMCKVDMELKRPEMTAMTDGIAKHFGIKNHRPYEEKEVDEFMFNLPPKLKIHDVEYGKYALRLIAEKYLPKEIAWRKVKVGGPVYPVNKVMGWDKTEGEWGKEKYLKWQKQILSQV